MVKLEHDTHVDIATAHSRMAKRWKNRKWLWSELVSRCSKTVNTGETAAEYARMSREEQSNIKDVGGFVGGFLNEGKRKSGNVLFRSVATLDIDHGTADMWEDFQMTFSMGAMMYSTHKHSEESPRYRLVFPLSRMVNAWEYEALCRKVAGVLGIDKFDDTTFELARLFYWPSTSKDAPFFFRYQDGAPCDVDAILREYANPKDASSWPVSSRVEPAVKREIRKAGDPEEKPGIIGAFCRAYSIEDAIETFLSGRYTKTAQEGRYTKTAQEGRYTYTQGSVAGGLVCYDGKFAYSHHETDPASRQLCNAFDLCRIHLFGNMDESSRTADVTKLPSYSAMSELAAKDTEVLKLLYREKKESINSDFEGIDAEDEASSDEWATTLERDKRGVCKSTTFNIIQILENEIGLKDHFYTDLFSGGIRIEGGLPWDANAVEWSDNDDANLRAWLETEFGITGREKIQDAVAVVARKKAKHPVRDYLNSLEWDGVERLDRLIVDYIGAEDNDLNRAITRMHFSAAVARVMEPGVKYDYCLILAGPEGAGKSSLLSIMGGKWFNDSITTMEGKEGMDQLRRSWIIELGELSGIKRSEVEQVKAFLSKTSDIYRAAYKRRASEHPRQCVFCGTTNELHFLKGDTGNRRFLIVPVDPSKRKYSDWRKRIIEDRDQLWAEAVVRYRRKERLYLSDNLERQAKERQDEFNDDADDPMLSLLDKFLDMQLPADWDSRDIESRRSYIHHPDPLDPKGVTKRERVCAMEFICEQLGRDKADKDLKYLARKINAAIAKTGEWEAISKSRHCEAQYGRQRAFKRIKKYIDTDL